MAVFPMGAAAPAQSPSALSADPQAPRRAAPVLAPASTRTRRLHAAFAFGPVVASVHTTRRDAEPRSTTLTLADGTHAPSVAMLPAQARQLARALLDAAEAADLVQRQRDMLQGGAQ